MPALSRKVLVNLDGIPTVVDVDENIFGAGTLAQRPATGDADGDLYLLVDGTDRRLQRWNEVGAAWQDLQGDPVGATSGTQGDLLARGASAWSVLQPGAVGRRLTSQGSGVVPTWVLPSVFGDYFQSAISEGESATTSTIWQPKLTLTTPSLPAANYVVLWQLRLKTDTDNREVYARVQLDNTSTLGEYETVESPTSYYRYSVAGHVTLALGAGVHFIDIDYVAGGGAARTVSIKSARICFWRVG